MERKTKKIKSKKEKNLIKLDIVFILCCFIYVFKDNGIYIWKELTEYLNVFNGDALDCIIIILAILWEYTITFFSKCFIFIAIYLAFRLTKMKIIKENNKYEVIDNIKYYRERFNNITPAEISLIVDLEIESKKDIMATILQLSQKDMLEFDDKKIIIKNEYNVEDLRLSERQIIEMIRNKDFNQENIKLWKKYCIEEAKEDGYIKEKSQSSRKIDFSKNNKLTVGAFYVIFITIILMIFYMFTSPSLNMYERLYEFEQYEQKNSISEIEILNKNPEMKKIFVEILVGGAPFMIGATMIIISFFIILGTPIYRWMKRKIYKVIEKGGMYERTKEGKILVEQIIGIKNYIHDFSLLSEKEKEDISLWEDFLIYAVVLEENKDIIDDICNYKNIRFNIISEILE